MSKEQIFREALALSPRDRETLVEVLLVSDDNISSAEIEKLWITEAERRLDMIESGETQTLNGPQVLSDLRASLSA